VAFDRTFPQLYDGKFTGNVGSDQAMLQQLQSTFSRRSKNYLVRDSWYEDLYKFGQEPGISGLSLALTLDLKIIWKAECR
jgi:hypothetical protein